MEDVDRIIFYLKKGRRTPQPLTTQNKKDWEPRLHDIMDPGKYPKIKVMTEMERQEVYEDSNGTVQTRTIPAKYTYKEPNRISLPIEQDIVNIQTSFTVGTEPSLECQPSDDAERGLFTALKQTFNRNKLKYQNRRIVRSWLAEQEIAEYWYRVSDDGFWQRIRSKVAKFFGFSVMPNTRLESQLWSPFRGDEIYPFYDEDGNYRACSRAYKKRDLDGNEYSCFMTVTDSQVLVWEQGREGRYTLNTKKSFNHGFGTCPVMYAWNCEAYTAKIRPIRKRIEKCLSGYADCIDNHFFPKLMLFGELQNLYGSDPRNVMLQMEGEGAAAQYLTWNQSADPIKVEIETYFNQAYALTNTPRISFDQIRGTGSALSGTAFRYVFMAAHMAVENHGEVLGEFLQRRVNFLVRALGIINTSFEQASKTIEVQTQLIPYIIDSDADKVSTSVQAVSGGVWSLEHGVAYCSDYGQLHDELEALREQREEERQRQAIRGFSNNGDNVTNSLGTGD